MKKLLLVVAALCGLVSTAASKDDPRFLWPKNSQFSCRGVLVQDGDTYRLKADANMLAWCDADIADNNEGRVLAVCKLGDRCEIKGVIMGHGAPSWTEGGVCTRILSIHRYGFSFPDGEAELRPDEDRGYA
jgi:hypothetical protein